MSPKQKTYELTLKVKTLQTPKDLMWYITRKLKDVMPVLSLEFHEIDDRPTSVEHHGGVQVTPLSKSQEEKEYMENNIPERY
tara:strand:+ start:276 stop:521 length:246 start_codon:yes stop_codon:yes gene_type:complete